MIDGVEGSYYMVVRVSEEQWAKDPRYYKYNTSTCRTLEDAKDLADAFDELGIDCIILQHKDKTMKTVVPVKAVADLMDPLSGDKYDALLPITITIEGGRLTLGTHDGPDLWRAKLKDLMTEGNIYAINKHLDEREDYDAPQEVTTELEQCPHCDLPLASPEQILAYLCQEFLNDD